MKRWIATILTLMLLAQALPWTAFAAAGDAITDSELNRALQIAGLKAASDGVYANSNGGDLPFRLEANASDYHKGMTPNETWDAQMLMDWLDDMLSQDLYHVTNVFTRADTALSRMKADDPAAYARFTQGTEFAGFAEQCHSDMLAAEAIEEQARFLRNAIGEEATLIENNTERLANLDSQLFDAEKARLSEQLREATARLTELRQQVLQMIDREIPESQALQDIIDGAAQPEFSDWLHGVLSDEDGVQRASVSANAIQVSDAGTRVSRMAAVRRVLSNDDSKDVSVLVINKNQFAIELHGVDNQPVGGVKITVKDLNGKAVETKTTDAKFGSVVFDANNYVNDFDYTMELSIEADASAQGYRSFYIPWTIVDRGSVRRETLILLTGPETKAVQSNATKAEKEALAVNAAAEGKVKPYAYSCMFNGLDILRQDVTVYISPLNDADLDMTLTVNHGSGDDPGDPVMHFRYFNNDTKKTGEETMKPTKKNRVSDTQTEYVYTKKWKQYLAPDVVEDNWPYFVIPSTNEKVTTKLAPVRSKVDQPIATGQEPSNPFNTVFTQGFGLDIEIPGIGGKLGFNLPFEQYLPKITYNPVGYITVAWGSQLIDPKEPKEWKNTEAKVYDRAMKRYQHETSLAQKKQATGMASNFYKGIFPNWGQARLKLDVGFFVMGSGRVQVEDDGSALWGFSAMAGFEVVLSFDYTQMMQIGPVPLYLNLNIALSAGVGVDALHVTWKTDKNSKPTGAQFSPIHSVTINLRLTVTVTIGVGIKGLCSLWVSGSGMLNFLITINISAPTTLQVYLEANVAVGFEIFWIKYSRVVWTSPRVMLLDKAFNEKTVSNPGRISLFDAYAEANDDSQQADVVPLEPSRYPALAPEAKLVSDTLYINPKVVRYKDYEYCLDIKWSDNYGWLQITNLTKYNRVTAQYYMDDFFKDNHLNRNHYSVYDYDVYNDGDRLHLLMTMAKSFDADGRPVPGGTQEAPNIILAYLEFEGIWTEDYSSGSVMPRLKKAMLYRWIVHASNGISPICSNPHIEGVQVMDGKPIVLGTLFGQSEYNDRSQYNTFCIRPDRPDPGIQTVMGLEEYNPSFAVWGDVTVSPQGQNYRRVAMNSSLRNWAAGSDSFEASQMRKYSFRWNLPCMGFIALEKPSDDAGDSYIELFDYYQNLNDVAMNLNNSSGVRYVTADYRRSTIQLAKGEIGAYELLQMSDGKSDPSQAIFYTQKETAGGREDYRLKGIYLAPRKIDTSYMYQVDYDFVFSDYDLSLPTPDFDAVTLGVSQYLYWLSTAPREKESDPKVWRISGVYYDQSTASMSDELVIAEFTLPQVSYNGKKYEALPQRITLTDAGEGFLTVVPDVGEGEYKDLPLTLYRFPTTLKAHMNMQKAALMETTVVQGDFVHTDFSMMNDSNMGIGSFDVDVVLMKDGKEQKSVETLHADLLTPSNSTLTLHGDKDEVVATGEKALSRDKDFTYSPKQHDWLVKAYNYSMHMMNGGVTSSKTGDTRSSHVVTNVLVPGALGMFAGSIKIPDSWEGTYELRLKVKNYSTYANWLAASALAKSNPELFIEEPGISANAAESNREKLRALGIVRLDYALDEARGKMVLQNTDEVLANGDDDAPSLYALEVDAPESVEVNCEVHDLQVNHRLWDDYYGEKMLDITLHNYYNNGQALDLTCAIYLDDSSTPIYVSLPYDPSALSADKTTTVSLPLSALFDPADHRSARFVFTPRGIEETANVNNEFTIYTGGSPELHFSQDIRAEITRGGTVTAYADTIRAREGETVTLHVSVGGGTKPYQYQWQVYDPAAGKWVDLVDGKGISGANTDTLTLQNVKAAWDGRRARCVVTDANGATITSGAVTLRVAQSATPTSPDTGDHSSLPLYLAIALAASALLAILRRRERDGR